MFHFVGPLGAWLSRLVHHRLDARRMRLFVLVFALVSGLVLMFGA